MSNEPPTPDPPSPPPPAPDLVLWHQSGVNAKGEPFVQLILGERVIAQQTTEDARAHAAAILEAAEAAEQDAFLLEFFQKHVEMTLEEAGAILMQFRKWRRERTMKSQPPTAARQFIVNPPPEPAP